MKRELSNLEIFLTADYETQSKLLKEPETKAEVEAWMGTDAFRQFESEARIVSHLGAGPKNVIFAPGVMGSTLQSNGLGGVWWLDMARARDKLDQLKLTDDGKGDADEDAEIVAGAVDVSYVPFRRAVATSDVFGGTVQFPYDWRRSIPDTAESFRDLLLKTFNDYQKPVHLVGHSMGGLIIRTALMIHGKELWPKIGRIVFIGTPHYGSASIAGYLKNHLWGWQQIAILGLFLSRETFRSLRGVLSLLPAPAGIYPGTRNSEEHPCANFNMYDAEAWKLNLDAPASVRLQNILDEVKRFYTDLTGWHNSLLQSYKDKMLMIAGVGQESLFRLEYKPGFWGDWKKTKKITSRIPCDPNRDSDGSVPLASAQLEDVPVRYVKGQHGALPNIPAVAREVLAWLTEADLSLAETCQGALSQHLSAEDDTTRLSLLDGSEVRSRFSELPEFENATPEFRAEIAMKLDAGEIPQINLIKIL